ncbi:MAG: phage tail protein [Desulfovibrionaceae bacterium]|jgi:phage protein U|nr:phage tail protein [Desulfovibrionaceae bacterium]
MSTTMMALGQFMFGLDTLAFEQLQRATDYRHPTNSRVGAMPARQFAGLGDDKITLTGLQVPEFKGDRKALDTLRKMAADGAAYALVAGAGTDNVLGAWVIESVQQTGSIFIAEGVPRRVEFSLQLDRVEDKRAEPDGGASAGGNPAFDDDFTDYDGGDGMWEWWL